MNKMFLGLTIRMLTCAGLLATPFTTHAAKVFMMGGATAETNNEIYAGLRASTSRNWTPNTSIYTNCVTDWNTTTCPRVAVVTASADTAASGDNVYNNDDATTGALSYIKLFQKHGFAPKHITAHADNYTNDSYSGNAVGNANIAIINQADVVFFNGGDQSRAARTFLTNSGADTPLMAALRTRVNNGSLVIAGTSAGTMIQANPMMGEGVAYGVLYFNANFAPKSVGSATGLKDDRSGTSSLAYLENAGTMTGFGFSGTNVAVDTHCNARGRVARLLAGMRNTSKTQGVCVDEDTAIYLNGSAATIYGSNGVSVADTANAIFPTASYFKVTGAQITYLTSGDAYNFSTKTATSSKSLITRPYNATYYDSAAILDPNEITKSLTWIVDSTTAYNVGTAPKPVYTSGPTYPSSAIAYKIKFYKDSNTKGYYSSGKYSAVRVLVDIY
ncbi:cyanophycinase [Undibacterium sp. 5I1]|uniref:cyanophycinase n=1 Tax=unclassified Undibacterium TaxID=2630295 RepID=UPI002AB425BC|nr:MULTISPECIES: cyanophycinase [unclassified Undibacterium]MDY7536680.1 cyanophycinase [Undibacterium sp. 5I1]MEB0230275.1 cyanophycinase [Undibacterium sp. 10I3]MEB0257975.1 cyanophycinase [Undibacterium sp. 5I1]